MTAPPMAKEPPIEDRLAHAADNAARLALQVVARETRISALEREAKAARELFAAILLEHGGRYSVPLARLVEVTPDLILNRVDEFDHVVFWVSQPTLPNL